MRLELIPVLVLNNSRQPSGKGRRPRNNGRQQPNNTAHDNRYPEGNKGSFAGLPMYTPISFEIITGIIREKLVDMMEKVNNWLVKK